MSPQILLALGVGLPLLVIGLYALWLGRRVDQLEAREPSEQARVPEDDEAPE